AYVELMENGAPPPGGVADESLLPAPKQRMKEALAHALARAANDEFRSALIVGYLQLADYQPNVGKTLGFTPEQLLEYQSTSKERLQELVAKLEELKPWQEKTKKESELLRSELKALGFSV